MLPVQCRMARCALGWTADELGRVSGVSGRLVYRFENHGTARRASILKIKATIEAAGVEFSEEGDQVGVAIRVRQEQASSLELR